MTALLLSVAALAMVGFHHFSGRAYGLDPTPTLFVTDGCTDAVLAFPASSNGNVAPLEPSTGLASPAAVAIDKNGLIYAANTCTNTITIYAKGSTGDTLPIATIGGTNTGLIHLEVSRWTPAAISTYPTPRQQRVYLPAIGCQHRTSQ